MNKKILIIGIFVCIMLLVPTVIANNNSSTNSCNKIVENPRVQTSECSEIKRVRVGGACNNFKVKGISFEIFRN